MHSMQHVLLCLAQASGTVFANKAVKLIRKNDYSSLVKLEISPSDYSRAEAYQVDAQVVALFRKLEGLPTGVDLVDAAVQSFYASEKECERTNNRLSIYLNWFERGFHGDAVDLRLFNYIVEIRNEIRRILGQIPLDLVPRLSGGSTYYDKGDEITIPHKMSSRPTVTNLGWCTIADLWRDTLWARSHTLSHLTVQGNRFTTVPKDSRKNRGICVEPSLNVSYQLAVGTHLRERLLLKTGIDIKGTNGRESAQTTHRKLAQKASILGSLSTIDLSNASDTISSSLVRLLLPKEWFDLLNSLRSHFTLIENKWVKLHKFSSMGNGFTFELETMIFYSIVRGLHRAQKREDLVSVYGDDIILPTVDSHDALSALRFFGFTPNEGKSHVDALDPFRESCGGDFFNGVPVRPVFLKEIPSCPLTWMELCNQITLMGQRCKSLSTTLLNKARRICVSMIPKIHRLYGPQWAGAGCIHHDDRTLWKVRPHLNEVCILPCHDEFSGYFDLQVLVPQQRKLNLSRFSGPVVLASALLGVPSTGPIPRGGTLGVKKRWRPTVM